MGRGNRKGAEDGSGREGEAEGRREMGGEDRRGGRREEVGRRDGVMWD